MALYVPPFTIDKLYSKAVYVFKYWYSLKTPTHNSRNMHMYLHIQESVQFVGDEPLYVYGLRGIFTILRVGASLSGLRVGLNSVVPSKILVPGRK
jgi:hypothetical protein